MDRLLVDNHYTLDKLAPTPLSFEERIGGLESMYHFFIKMLWAFFLLFLPITNFPIFPNSIGGTALVRPLSLYPLILLFLIYTLPRLIFRSFPKTFLSLLPFLLAAAFSSIISLFRGIEPIMGIPVYERVLRTLLTLGIGSAAYFSISLLHSKLKDLNFSLRWMYAGLTAALVWGSLQAVYIVNFNQQWFDRLEQLQRFVSTRHLFTDRISGLTYEPNWFAEQLTFLYMPWLWISVLSGKSVFPWRRGWFTIELVLLTWTIFLLPFTFSRAGVLNMVLSTVFGWFFYVLQSRKYGSKQRPITIRWSFYKLRTLMRYLIQTTIIVSLIVIPVYLVGANNSFFARVWEYWQNSGTTLSGYLNYLGFDARLIFSEAAYNTYNAHPLIGVGLGNYAYYFEDMLPFRPLAASPEVMQLVTPEQGRVRLITAKNFYLRLLAETGVIGFSAFITFLVAVTGCAIYLWLSPKKKERFWGTAGLCVIFSFLITAVSFDSFAIPNMWVALGLVTSAAWVTKQSGYTQA